MNSHIFLASPHMSDEGYEQKFVKEAFDTNWVAPLGENVNEFEKEVAGKIGAHEAAALTSGTAAIHLALLAIGVKKEDVVFCQSLTFSATANPIIYVGAKPVFIDSDEETWNMSPIALKIAMEKYKKINKLPKAVIFVHLYGMAAKIDELCAICNEYNVPVIEDAAESLGTTYKGKYTGTFGEYGVLSFNGNKIITTSGGGMLVCNGRSEQESKKRADKIRFWATQSRENYRWYQHTEIGYNYRMSNVVAGIGRGQMMVLNKRVDKKRYIYDYYKKKLGILEGLSLIPMHEWEYCNCWLTAIQVLPKCKIKPIDIMQALEEDNVESRPVWKPMHLQPVFAKYDFVGEENRKYNVVNIDTGADDSVSGKLFEYGVCLPSDTKITDDDLERICNVIKKLWE
ncbi:DegT/DnrJ/EryC1/StrS family aminotransferase [Lachnotalea glycerini]|uniref:Aminotransferase class I/II-fold pyridoxal phosphate-dependent enzyme n=1 Tax=Lachnotalea glycerini TaxID=1763509 RepID=A0A371JG47_9FIRM|nr:aminotransferase class I/II-fold pyridoxal phosphate-dependent enzyme [Lachnotalea glycerini]RDY31722.1 aminotransferase class I/II-fold pyridoxal phosphate-dependent enzyme [Lachnotalea glycerini]